MDIAQVLPGTAHPEQRDGVRSLFVRFCLEPETRQAAQDLVPVRITGEGDDCVFPAFLCDECLGTFLVIWILVWLFVQIFRRLIVGALVAALVIQKAIRPVIGFLTHVVPLSARRSAASVEPGPAATTLRRPCGASAPDAPRRSVIPPA